MNVEEYKSIRDEMLQRFRWTFELSFFAVVSTGGLLSWLSTQSGTQLKPYLFICVGLGIIGFLFYSYRVVLEEIYNQGSYLAIFHEGDEAGFRWHRLSRLRDNLIGEKSEWGKDGRRGGFLLAILVAANVGGPLWFLRDNLNFWSPWDWFSLLMLVFGVALLLASVFIIGWGLFSTAEFMRKNMRKWGRVKERLEKDPNLPENTMKRVLDCSNPGVKETSGNQKRTLP